ncbi:ArnT family glycosyltransferase [Aerosakkonemataceae cyanobacterium BLCC-F50]|uniref:ArnT family glycosyltransferase n=1 Tax=Floridaenema flaviceps BLCC-F50 TaxID=3153642 RepID=A0ABV4Y2F3_9CYAN
MFSQRSYSFKNFLLTVAIPIIAFWILVFLLGYPLPSLDDIFFTGAAINLSKGGEFTNPYLEAWNSVLSSGKFYYQPPFYSYTLAGWLKIAGINTTSLRLFQYLCYATFSLSSALLLRFYGFPRITAFCVTVLFALWHCNPNPFYSTGFRHDALGMAFLALGLWLLAQDNWWRYFLGFSFIGSAVFTSPITSAYGFSFGLAILAINVIYRGGINKIDSKYILLRTLALLAASGLVFTLFLLCINFELKTFISDFVLTASWRKAANINGIIIFFQMISRAFGIVLNVPSYLLFLAITVILFRKRHLIPMYLKILFFGLTMGMILNMFLYAFAWGFNFFFCWVGIVCIVSLIGKSKLRLYAVIGTFIIYLSSQTLNIISLVGREDVPKSKYEEIKEAVLAKPNRKYAIDSVSARFVFDYNLPKNSIDWLYMKPAPAGIPDSLKDKKPDVSWIVSRSNLSKFIPEMQLDYPRVKFMGQKFDSLPKKPFDIILIP